MNLSATTVYTKERLLRFNSFFAMSRRFFWITLLVCVSLVSSVFFLSILIEALDKIITIAFIAVWCFALLYFLMTVIVPRLLVKKTPSLNAEVTYTFDAESFTTEFKTSLQIGTEQMNYSVIKKIMESDTDIYLFVNNATSFIIDKSGFKSGSAEELIAFLKAKNIKYKR